MAAPAETNRIGLQASSFARHHADATASTDFSQRVVVPTQEAIMQRLRERDIARFQNRVGDEVVSEALTYLAIGRMNPVVTESIGTRTMEELIAHNALVQRSLLDSYLLGRDRAQKQGVKPLKAPEERPKPPPIIHFKPEDLTKLTGEQAWVLRQTLKGLGAMDMAWDNESLKPDAIRQMLNHTLSILMPGRQKLKSGRPTKDQRALLISPLPQREPFDPLPLYPFSQVRGPINDQLLSTSQPLLSFLTEHELRLDKKYHAYLWAYFGDFGGVFVVPGETDYCVNPRIMQNHMEQLQTLVTAVRKRYDGRQPASPVAELLHRAREGNVYSFVQLYQHIRKDVANHLEARFSEDDARSLVPTFMGKICDALSMHDETIGKGSPSTNLRNWYMTIVKHNELNELDRRQRQRRQSGREANYQIPELPAELMQRVEELSLEAAVASVVNLALKGMNIDAIAETLSISQDEASRRLTRGRTTIEEHVLTDAGYKRRHLVVNASLSYDRVKKATNRGNLKAVRFLGVVYTTDQAVMEYMRALDEEMVDEPPTHGELVLVREETSPTEYHTIMGSRRYRELLVRIGRKVYMERENLEEAKSSRAPARPRRINGPTPEHKLVTTFARSPRDLEQLHRAARTGQLKTTQHGVWWFTTDRDVNEYREFQSTNGAVQ